MCSAMPWRNNTGTGRCAGLVVLACHMILLCTLSVGTRTSGPICISGSEVRLATQLWRLSPLFFRCLQAVGKWLPVRPCLRGFRGSLLFGRSFSSAYSFSQPDCCRSGSFQYRSVLRCIHASEDQKSIQHARWRRCWGHPTSDWLERCGCKSVKALRQPE